MPPDPSTCNHDYAYLGLQWWRDQHTQNTLRYVNTFYCRRCLAKVFELTEAAHSAVVRPMPNAVPMSSKDLEMWLKPPGAP